MTECSLAEELERSATHPFEDVDLFAPGADIRDKAVTELQECPGRISKASMEQMETPWFKVMPIT